MATLAESLSCRGAFGAMDAANASFIIYKRVSSPRSMLHWGFCRDVAATLPPESHFRGTKSLHCTKVTNRGVAQTSMRDCCTKSLSGQGHHSGWRRLRRTADKPRQCCEASKDADSSVTTIMDSQKSDQPESAPHKGELMRDPSQPLPEGVSRSPPVDSGPADAPMLESVAGAVGEVAEEIEKAVELIAKIDDPILAEVTPPQATGEEIQASALKSVGFWVSSAVAFGAVVGLKLGPSKASEFFAGYLLEQSLSVDNLFVFVLVFNYFKVPVAYQSRVLSFGIAGAVFFRAVMISLGVTTLQRFEFVNLIFASILLFSSYKLLAESEEEEEDLSNNSIVKLCRNFIPVTSEYDGNRFYTVVDGVSKATPLLLTLAVVELSDVAFAVDSIPAVFGVTRDPLIVFSSNIFAILGLRSLYTVISGSMAELHYLQPSIAIVLGFVGSKMVADFFGFHIPTELSLAVVVGVLGTGVLLSLGYTPDEKDSQGR